MHKGIFLSCTINLGTWTNYDKSKKKEDRGVTFYVLGLSGLRSELFDLLQIPNPLLGYFGER